MDAEGAEQVHRAPVCVDGAAVGCGCVLDEGTVDDDEFVERARVGDGASPVGGPEGEQPCVDGHLHPVYGDMPAHDGLWQSAMDTAHDLLARIAIVPLVLEARGLDVTPAIIARLTKAEDTKSAEILTLIYDEEISHVHAGQKWFNYLCERQNFDPVKTYQKLVQQYFKGQIKPPFNKEARSRAGFEEKYYLPLAQEKN